MLDVLERDLPADDRHGVTFRTKGNGGSQLGTADQRASFCTSNKVNNGHTISTDFHFWLSEDHAKSYFDLLV